MVDVGYRNACRIAMFNLDLVPGSQLAFLDHGKIKTTGVAGYETLDEVIAIKTNSKFVTGHARLLDHQQRRSDAHPVPDIKGFFPQTFGSQVLAEGAPLEIGLRKLFAPVCVVLRRITIDRLVDAAVNGKIGLLVATQI